MINNLKSIYIVFKIKFEDYINNNYFYISIFSIINLIPSSSQ